MRIFMRHDGGPLFCPETSSFLWPDDAATDSDPGFSTETHCVVYAQEWGWAVKARADLGAH